MFESGTCRGEITDGEEKEQNREGAEYDLAGDVQPRGYTDEEVSADATSVSDLLHMLERTVYARSSRLIVLSDAFGQILSSRYGVSPDRIRVVPGCVNVAQFDLDITKREARRRLQLPQDQLAVRPGHVKRTRGEAGFP